MGAAVTVAPAALLRAALALAEARVPVFPLRERDKRPWAGSRGFKDATTDREQVRGWWMGRPESNIGVPTGAVSGIVALDVDPRHGGVATIKLLTREKKLPVTRVMLTAGPDLGIQYLFAVNGEQIRTRTLGPGVEIRGEGAYTLWPPSIHPLTGKARAFINPNTKMALFPAWLLELAASNTSTLAMAVLPPTIRDGSWHTTMISAAGRLRAHGFTRDAAIAALVTQNEQTYRGAFASDEQDILEIVDDLWGRYPAGEEFGADNMKGIVFATGDERLRVEQLGRVRARQVRWLVPGMIPVGALTLVAGVGGLGKGTWLIQVAARASRDELGDPADTILVSFEDPAAEVLRPRVEAAGGDLERIHHVYVAGDGIDSVQLPRDLEELRRVVRQVHARLVVIDPIVAAVNVEFDTHKDQHVRHVLAGLAELCVQESCAVALVGHLNKAASTEAYLRVANSVAFWNAARSVVLVTEDPDDTEAGRLIAQRKANWGRRSTVERHRLEEVVLDTQDPNTGLPIVTSRMVFVEYADDIDANDVLASRGRDTKTAAAQLFLERALADGDWHDAEGLRKLAGAQGIAERTLQLAKRNLNVEHERRGFGHPVTWWRLALAQL
jgi:hypothetical protein